MKTSAPTTASFLRTILRVALATQLALLVNACGPEYPNCRDDEGCHEGEFCVDGQCQQCRADADCGAGRRCASGACEAIPVAECTDDSTCGEGRSCMEGRCVARSTSDSDVTSGPVDEGPSCATEAVYFGFDESTLSRAARDVLAGDARCLAELGSDGTVLTGMADPRGTAEYNLALGERRAQSVRDYLGRLGVERRRLHVRSVGAELAQGTDEESWSRDRRVELESR